MLTFEDSRRQWRQRPARRHGAGYSATNRSCTRLRRQTRVVHADVKPGNLIITPAGEVKLIDFGVARVRQQENEGKWRAELAVNESGTPAYSSMQVLTGEDPAPADDVFSLACLFYRLVAGYRVYGPRNAAQAAEDGMEPQRPQALSAAQWQPLKKCLVILASDPIRIAQGIHKCAVWKVEGCVTSRWKKSTTE